MPLPACKPKNQYSVYFATLGPYGAECDKESIQREVRAITVKHFGEKRVKDLITTAEQGATGYKHIHLGVHLITEARWMKLCKELKRLANTWKQDDDETRAISCRFFYVPNSEKGRQSHFDVIRNYVVNPIKDKEVGEYIEYEERDKWWITDGKITNYRAAICDLMGVEYIETSYEKKLDQWERMSDVQKTEAHARFNAQVREHFLRNLKGCSLYASTNHI